MSKNIYGKVPAIVRRRTYYFMKKYNLDLADAFKESVRMGGFDKAEYSDLVKAWYFDDYREFIPGEYFSRYLDFNQYPLPYKA